jgi:hypothetical protein
MKQPPYQRVTARRLTELYSQALHMANKTQLCEGTGEAGVDVLRNAVSYSAFFADSGRRRCKAQAL